MNETRTYKNLKFKPKDNYPKWIIVHHSGGTDKNPLEDTSHHTAQIMESWHFKLGWEGLGYHYVIHKDGAIWKGRPEHYHSAQAVGYNSQSIGICMAGNFDATLPTEKQIESLKLLLSETTKRYNLTLDKIVPHRKFANKTCYGRKLSDTWASDLIKPKKDEEVCIRIPKSRLQKILNFLKTL